jgi:hypothetical protein
MQMITWPANADCFLPRPFISPSSSPYAESAATANIKGSFANPTTPDLLITGLDEAIDFSQWNLIETTPDGVLKYGEGIPWSQESMKAIGTIALIGTSGVGKTRVSLQLAYKELALIFVCDKRGNGGSNDMATLFSAAAGFLQSGRDTNQTATYIHTKLDQAVSFRLALYEECIKKYGENNFGPSRFAMLQLYSPILLGVDVFDEFMKMDITNYIRPQPTRVASWIVLDEAQVTERTLPNTFPSSSTPDGSSVKRSIFKPILSSLQTFVDAYTCLLICGTGISFPSLNENFVSGLKPGVQTRIIGLGNFLEEEALVSLLRKWGIHDANSHAHADELKEFIGRPRFGAYVAQRILVEGWNLVSTVKTSVIQQLLGALISKLNGRELTFPHEVIQRIGERSLGWYMKYMATQAVLGRDALVARGSTLAIECGIGTLEVKRGGVTLREPITVDVLIGNSGKDFETILAGSDSAIGYEFEDYLVFKSQVVAAWVSDTARDMVFGRPPFSMKNKLAGFPWVIRTCKDGDEPTILQEILQNKTTFHPTIIACGTKIGADLIYVFFDSQGRPVVVFCQSKSGLESFPMAFSTLELPYYVNRNKADQKCGNTIALEALKKCISNNNATVVFLAVKPIGDPKAKYPAVVQDEVLQMQVLKLVMSKSHRPEEMKDAWNSLHRFKGLDVKEEMLE